MKEGTKAKIVIGVLVALAITIAVGVAYWIGDLVRG